MANEMFKIQLEKIGSEVGQQMAEGLSKEIIGIVKTTWDAAIEEAAKQCDEMGEEARISDHIRNLKIND